MGETRSAGRLLTLLLAASAAGCSDSSTGGDDGPSLPPAESEVVLQAVDAGTGDALSDGEMTVRYLVRSPVTLDATGAEAVSSDQPYRIAQSVAADSLVVEVRLDAPSYYRLDTALAVGRGASAGPFTLRMTRRLERTAGGATGEGGAGAATTGGETGAGGTGGAPPDASVDRARLDEGDRAFEAGEWVVATEAYDEMPPPSDPESDYGRAYQQGLLRMGISHIELGEWGSALDALDRSASLPTATAISFFHLGRAECQVGRIDDGRSSLQEVAARSRTIPVDAREAYVALAGYQQSVCSQIELDQAEGTSEIIQAGSRTLQELTAFLDAVEMVSSTDPGMDALLQEATVDAREREADVRARLLEMGRN